MTGNFTDEPRKQLTACNNRIDDTLLAAEDLPEIGQLYIMTRPGELRVDIPFTSIAYAEYRQALGSNWILEQGTQQGQQDNDSDGYWYFVHKYTGIRLTLCLNADNEYATCKRIKVGAREVPIYETVCNEG